MKQKNFILEVLSFDKETLFILRAPSPAGAAVVNVSHSVDELSTYLSKTFIDNE